ncbi:seven-hairpin glycosidase [Lindgomyces ingoldianus]|uniref:Seven-hairpin glycosidase n=1 Tax=Lindgomyces ingoldianus TaxID=673940 RepID=A0ACB6QE26_9PLEO|nr:seven-hairpin glycosidase [Lindgomyces ingoldianus]KAF2465284.1 seven-hairpin glycosidase [Lindgomyces ingoldianus]
MTDNSIAQLRQETRDIFYHGYDNYMKHAFPEDELRPLTCAPLTRDRLNPAHIEVNDVLGNYSLTLIDSLSTLAILASSPPPAKRGRNKPLDDFQDGIKLLVEYYGDGTLGSEGQGKRARGFDLDSKVQVFETVIRGVGGLLSAHLFAIGELPIRGYQPTAQKKRGREGIEWRNGLVYDGQLLRLATDLAERLMPAFHTPTGLPYPRVNLRHGVPFYANSPYNTDAEHGQCKKDPSDKGTEITETCSAGAGSLVLEFSTLSRLTGDARFESAAKDAFWAVWQRRTSIGLIGAGIDSETGQWVSPFTGIGAGIDSFFEYSIKTHILLSGLPYDVDRADVDSPDSFLRAWEAAHDGIKRHIYRGAAHQHPHYIQVDLYTGAMRAFWIDSLSAYYQGLLTLAGELDEAIETHLLYTALWTRYSGMPERWSTATGNIEGGLRWWGGRPEFIESTWYLYRATKDPWYLHVGEMALRDIKRRCWTKCGWAGLHDVRTGELSDRMESFFLGETAKYLFLLFDPSHPLNTWDAPFVFTTEGHPLVVPKRLRQIKPARRSVPTPLPQPAPKVCPLPPPPVPFSISATAARPDIFHAASLARLHLMPTVKTLESPLVEFNADHPSISISDIQSPSNYTYYPWTLPPELIPRNATSSRMQTRTTFDLSFPNLPNTLQMGSLQRINEGILVNSMSGLRLGMIREPDTFPGEKEIPFDEHFRIYAISNVALGRDEKVYMSRSTIESFNPVDPFFTRTRDTQMVDLIIDAPHLPSTTSPSSALSDFLDSVLSESANISNYEIVETLEMDIGPEELENEPSYFSSLLASLQSLLSSQPSATPVSSPPTMEQQLPEIQRFHLPGTLPTGPGAAPLPDIPDPDLTFSGTNPLTWSSIYVHSTQLCEERLPIETPRTHQVIVIPRGGCSFSTKLRNIPAFPPKSGSLQLVVIVSYPEHEQESFESAPTSSDLETDDGQWSNDKLNMRSMRRQRRLEDQQLVDSETIQYQDPPSRNKKQDIDPESSNSKASPKMSKKRRSPSQQNAGGNTLVQPLLDNLQFTPSGLPRPNPIPLVMVGGGHETMDLLKRAKGVQTRRRYYFLSQGVRIANLIVL